ncbi:MAG TPA: arylsulfotransferase family protein [Solirubrobacteraceae bacterium]|nr:arylsulfotransferase family protein [Solirubrobacteraceae bacterium]
MPQIHSLNTLRRTPRRWRHALVSIATILAAGVPIAATGTSAAEATTPTAPPPVSVLTSSGNIGRGDIFISPFGDASTYANGPEILDNQGNVVWFQAVPAGEEASDFRAQTYLGQPVLTWWQGTGLGGLSSGTDYIYNDHYQQIAAVNAGNGLSADGHEFLITPWNTALILSYTTATANLTSIGGPADQTVINGVVQEIDIATGQVLFQWNSADHVPYSQSEQPLPASASTPWDWFHINAVKLDSDGNLLIDARDTWTTYKVSLATGNIIWQLGGKDSSFTLQAAPGQTLDSANEIFAWQHDPESIGHNEYTFFDNESSGTPLLPYSRAITVKLDPWSKVATLVSSDNQPEGLSAASQGNAQTTGEGNLFVGWGILPYFSEFNPSGQLIFNAEFPAGVNTYRAYLLPWNPPSSGGGGQGPGKGQGPGGKGPQGPGKGQQGPGGKGDKGKGRRDLGKGRHGHGRGGRGDR